MIYSLLPDLTAAEKSSVSRYLTEMLGTERLTGGNWPLQEGRVGIYIDRRWYGVYHGAWQLSAPYVYIGGDNRNNNANIQPLDRLGVIAAVIAACGLWTDAITEAFGQAVSRIMLSAYNEMMHGLLTVQGSTPATGLAFSADRQQVAALMGDRYFLPNGQPIEIDATWTVVQ